MKIAYIDIRNFRGISQAKIYLNGHTVFIGDNNAGKSTIFEALDLVLGPDRLNKLPVIDEHDFYNGRYYDQVLGTTKIEIEVLVHDLSPEQIARFKNNLEFWNERTSEIIGAGEISTVDEVFVREALRVKFVGEYNQADDDFDGETFFCHPQNEEGRVTRFTKSDKRECGFLYLRALRTGARALSMERGSLLDIILHIREVRPQMWEKVLDELRKLSVAADESVGIKEILTGVQESLKEFVPSDWGADPHLRVSDLTREHLRKTLTVFMSTGKDGYHAPFQHQGTGTINTMVLALLSMIAEAKKNVIFAMEEPEIAIPPYTQKRIIDSIRKKSTQALFTSHSPFVLEEFEPEQIILIQRDDKARVSSQNVRFPSFIKPKMYNCEFRLRFSEALLAKRLLLTEGATEAITYCAAARRLNELLPNKYSSLEALGVAVFDVQSQTAVATYGKHFKKMGKVVFAVFDKQQASELEKITSEIDHSFESPYAGFEDLLLAECDEEILKQFYQQIIDSNEWPTHLLSAKPHDPNNSGEVAKALKKYLKWSKGSKSASDLISICTSYKQIPLTIRKTLKAIKAHVEPVLEKVNDY